MKTQIKTTDAAFLLLTKVKSEIFAIILFSRITINDVFARLKIRDKDMIYRYQ